MKSGLRRVGGWWAVAGAAVLSGMVLSGVLARQWLWPAPPAPPRLVRPAPRGEGFVSAATCAECHAEIAERYRSHPMSQSLAPIAGAAPVEDFQQRTQFEPSQARRYRVERDGPRVLHHEVGLGRNGQMVYDHREPIEYVLGSGRRGRSYLLNRDGFLFMSPISWYSQAGRWDLSPEYAVDAHPRFEREATDRCLQCHAGRMNYADRPSGELVQRYAEPPFLEHAIDCQRCHGPGEQHVAHWRKPGSQAADPIVNPAKLDPSRRDAVCLQCHLQGEHQVLRYGRSHADFRPGDALGEIWSVFVRPANDSPRASPAVSQAEQMRASACFLGSQGRLGCISCHDPHTVPEAAQRIAWYREKCLACHESRACRESDPRRQAEADSCIACHMPRFAADDVPHTTQTDHRVPRRARQPASDEVSPTASSAGSKRDDSPPLTVFDLDDCPLAPIELERARGLMLAERAEWQRVPGAAAAAVPLLARSLQAAPDDLRVVDALALCRMLENQTDQAVELWQRAIQLEPGRRDALFSLAIYYHNSGQTDLALEYTERYLRQFPWNAEMHGRHSHLLGESGRLDEAIAAAERALQLNPSVPKTYVWLSWLYEQRGDTRQSQVYRQLWGQLQ
ncbi:MAG: tetratricopeptide repeat protein [Pirellulaceae bacterium]|nr:tetratricopeptide repeat protein [Pirellulaceae bacterium]